MARSIQNKVTVIGAGILGLSCAYVLLRRGHAVRVLEAGPVGAGASGGVIGALSPHTPDQWNPKKQFQFESLLAAEGFWGSVAEVSGMAPGYARAGRVMPILREKDRELAVERIAAAQAHWGHKAAWSVLDEHPALPAEAAPFGVIHETLSARIAPRAALAALAAGIASLGGEIRTSHRVTALDMTGLVVLAAGTGGFELAGDLLGRSFGGGVKGQSVLLSGRLAHREQIFADGVYIVPHDDGTVAVGSTSENRWAHENTDALLDDVIARAVSICPDLNTMSEVERWAGIRPKAPKRDPMIGPLPGYPNVIAALGGFKIGFGIAPKLADMVACYVEGKDPDLPPSFTPQHHLQS